MGLEKRLQLIFSLYPRGLILIHIVENKAYKSDSDRSLRSYYDSLRERIGAADFNVNNLTLEIKETLEYINSVNEMLEEFRVELLGDVEEIRPFLPEKQKTNLDGTLDKIKEALQGNDIKDITKEIEDASVCLAACQSCFSGDFTRCENMDTCGFGYVPNPCTECVSEQTGCSFCNTGQTTECVIEHVHCGEEYTSACSSCYRSLYNTCAQNELSCDYSSGCTGCQINVQSCTGCQGNVGSCNNCHGGSFGECGEGQMNECGESHASCTSTQEVRCRSNNDCTSGNDSCTSSVGCLLFNNVVCPSNYRKGPPPYCEMGYKGNGESCGSGYNGSVCTTNFDSGGIECQSSYGVCSNEDGVSCAGAYRASGEECAGQYSVNVNGDGEEHCTGGYTCSGGQSCPNDYVVDSEGDIGCRDGYPGCAECYGTSYACSGCYDVDYCSKCNTSQTTCTTCVRGETTCTACVKGEEGHQEDVCSNCYGGCQATWEQQKDCFTGSYGTPPACTICNIGCQYCDTGCYSGQGCGDCGSANCGASNCGAGNCGAGNCGTSNCGAGQCNQSGCSNCDDISACVCSHTGSYGCNFPIYSS